MTFGRLCAVEKDGRVQQDANYLSYWTRVRMLEHVPDKFAAASAREVEVTRRWQMADGREAALAQRAAVTGWDSSAARTECLLLFANRGRGRSGRRSCHECLVSALVTGNII